jgi:dTDP-4-amino-4,6-dideoxygalactose transaminase
MIGEEEIVEVVDTLRSDWITTGPKVKRFEQEFASFVGAPEALAVSSCTAALHLALLALDIGPGDAVITTPLTFCSGVHVIEHVGARPILVDVEPDTLNLDSKRIRRILERAGRDLRVKAILPVDLYGHPCEPDALLALAGEHQLAIIEDAAHALPARHKGAMVGSHVGSTSVPMLTCFSFYATKNLTTAEGGMLVARPDLLDRARIWALHGMNRDAWKRYAAQGSWFYEVIYPGYKYNMTDVQAALGLQQLRKLTNFHARRQQIAEQYNATFSRYDEIQIPAQREHVEHAWHVYALRLKLDRLTISRNEFIAELRALNIGSSVHFIPVHLHRYYREKYAYKPEDFPIALREYQRIVSLPLSPKMTDKDVNDVLQAVTRLVEQYSVPMTSLQRTKGAHA